jgi:hypothetical protein
MKIGDKTTTDSGITWECVNAMTGEFRRVTPAAARNAMRRPVAMTRFFPPDVIDPLHGYSPNVFCALRDYINDALLKKGPGSADALRRWMDESFPDVAKTLRDELLEGWLKHPASMGLKPKTTT